MKVITIDNGSFSSFCRELELKCGTFKPDLVIGIATGGVYVAEQMFMDVQHESIRLRRPTSESKDAHERLFNIVRRFPRIVLDVLRIAEAYLLRLKKNNVVIDIDIPSELKTAVMKANRILVVDDAVDSGVTLKSVFDVINKLKQSNAIVKSAVFTITTNAPLIYPEFFLFSNRTLIRFPWSKDMKQ